MKKWTTRFWTGRTGIERSLIVALTVAVLGLLAVVNAWRRQLVPWATEWGNWAEWAGAIATALGFIFAVFTLSRNGKAEAKRRIEFQEMEASRVVVTVEFNHQKSYLPSSRMYAVTMHNAASSPVKRAMFFVDRNALPFSPHKDVPDPTTGQRIDFGTVPAGGQVTRDLSFLGTFEAEFGSELQRTICFWFHDVSDALWMHEKGQLKLVPSGKQYVEALEAKAALNGSDVREKSGRRGGVR